MENLKEGIDYIFKTIGDQAGVEILEGKYKDVILYYSNVSVSEPEEVNGVEVPPHLSFNYDMEYYANFSDEELHDEEFKNHAGNILMAIIMNGETKHPESFEDDVEYLEI